MTSDPPTDDASGARTTDGDPPGDAPPEIARSVLGPEVGAEVETMLRSRDAAAVTAAAGRALRALAAVAAGRLVFWFLLLVALLRDQDRRLRLRRWLLLEGDRRRLVAGFVGAVVAGYALCRLTGVVGLAHDGFVTGVFSSVVSGLFSFVPIVIAVNQLTVSRLFATPGDLRERIESVQRYRTEIEEMTAGATVAPTEPAKFLRSIVELFARRVASLERAAESIDDPAAAELRAYAATVSDHVEALREGIDGEEPPLFRVLSPMMGEEYSRGVNATRRLLAERETELPSEAAAALEDLRELYVSLDVARQYFKALYLQRELSTLSQYIAYTGFAAFLVSTFLVLTFASGAPSAVHGTSFEDLLVGGALGVVTTPFAVLLAYVLRVATIAKRTAAPGTFTPEATDRPFRADDERGDGRGSRDGRKSGGERP